MKTKQIELHKGSMGTSALVCGILGMFLIPVVLSVLAIIFGAIGINRNEKYAKAGLILGIIGFVFGIFMMLFLFFVFVGAVASL